VTANALALQELGGVCTAPGVSPDSVSAGVPPPQMAAVVNILAISSNIMGVLNYNNQYNLYLK